MRDDERQKMKREGLQREGSDRRWGEMAERIKRARDGAAGEIQEILDLTELSSNTKAWLLGERGENAIIKNLELPGRVGERVLAELSQRVSGAGKMLDRFIKFLVGFG